MSLCPVVNGNSQIRQQQRPDSASRAAGQASTPASLPLTPNRIGVAPLALPTLEDRQRFGSNEANAYASVEDSESVTSQKGKLAVAGSVLRPDARPFHPQGLQSSIGMSSKPESLSQDVAAASTSGTQYKCKLQTPSALFPGLTWCSPSSQSLANRWSCHNCHATKKT